MLLNPVADTKLRPGSNKISFVGAGQVGMACVFSCITQGVTANIALVDMLEKKVRGEMLDLQHGSIFFQHVTINASTDYEITKNSRICVVTAGARQNEGESRLSLVQRNVEIFKAIIPQLVKHSPDTILLIVSNPVDILTYVAWKLSGLPKNRVVGSGTSLDSSRLKFLLSQRIGVNARNCHGWIIGEHGDSSVAVWSRANVGGIPLRELESGLEPNSEKVKDTDNLEELHKAVINSAYEIISLKGYTSWAIGLTIANLCKAILTNSNSLVPVSTSVKGHYGISEDVFLSLPCVLGENGVGDIFKLPLEEEEKKKFIASAEQILEIQKAINL